MPFINAWEAPQFKKVTEINQLENQLRSIESLISHLQQQGYSIIYSDGLVLSSMQVIASSIDLETLEQSLAAYSLGIQQLSGFWIITPAEGIPETLEPESASRIPPVEQFIESVIVTGSLHQFPTSTLAGSSYRLLTKEMSQIPSLGSDVMRAMLRLPGVSSVGVSAKPRIRGGLQDEILVLQDGVELLEPFHLADYHSAYSAIDYHTVESVNFYTGGFPSRYGNRISGVMDINNDWSQEQYNTDLGISSFSSFINTRGESTNTPSTKWLLSYREGDLKDLTDYIETRSGEPTYMDLSARINTVLDNGKSISTGLVFSKDDIIFEDIEESAISKIDSYYLWARLDNQIRKNISSTTTISYIDFERHKNEFSEELVDVDEDEEDFDPSKGGLLDHKQTVKRLALRNDYTWINKSALVEIGWQAEYSKSKYDHSSFINRGELAEILDMEQEISRNIHVQVKGWTGGLYLAAELEPFPVQIPGLLLQPSLRWDFQRFNRAGHSQQWSPRLGMSYEINDNSLLRFSLGRFYQPERDHELQVIDGQTLLFKPQYADQAIFGVEWSKDQWYLSAEWYYKRYRDLKTRFENVFNPFVLLPEMEPDRVQLTPEKAFSKGLDIDIGYEFDEQWNFHFRYNAMVAKDRIDRHWISRRWSQDHTVNAVLAWNPGSFSTSIALVWHSGWRSSLMPSNVPVDSHVPLPTVLNNVTLKDYLSLDFSARYSWDFGNSRLQLYTDITNILDRNNIAGIDYDIEEIEGIDEELIAYQLVKDRETLLSIVPSIGFIWSF